MAVRDDFTAGEVLAAADLNDTFASKQADVMTTKGDIAAYGTAVDRLAVGTNGQVLTADSGETLGVKWADAAGGLTLITSESFSAVSSVSVNNCFTSTYENYRIVIATTAVGADLNIRMRVSGSDVSTSDYKYIRSYGDMSNGTTGTNFTTSGTLWNIGGSAPNNANGSLDIFRPNKSLNTSFVFSGVQDGYREISAGVLALNTAYDGFTLYPASGTLTGTLRVYGYKD